MSAMPASKHGNSSSRSSKAETGSAPGGEGGGQAVDPEENSLEVKGNSDASAPEQCAHENSSADKELISQTKQVSVSPKNTPICSASSSTQLQGIILNVLGKYLMPSAEMNIGSVCAVEMMKSPFDALMVGDSRGFVSMLKDTKNDLKKWKKSKGARSKELVYFQSHKTGFDSLKSTEIEPKISCMSEGPTFGQSFFSFMVSNSKTIKYYKAFERRRVPITKSNIDLEVKQKEKFECHQYSINSVSPSSDKSRFISSDDLCINSWHYEYPKIAHSIVDIRPPKVEDISEVITCSKYRPKNPNQFVYASSNGSLNLCDERERSSFTKGSIVYCNKKLATTQSTPFSEIFMIINDFEYSPDGNHIACRDYISVRTWDIRNPNGPVSSIPLIEFSKMTPVLVDLYDRDNVFDKFQLAWLNDSSHILTGFYGNTFSVLNPFTRSKHTYRIDKSMGSVENVHGHEISLGKMLNEKCSYVKMSDRDVAFISATDTIVAVDFQP